MEALKESSRIGIEMIHGELAERGILDLKDVQALDKNRIEAMLGLLACASIDDLYSAVGGKSIHLDELRNALDMVGISKNALQWSTIEVAGSNATNRPGFLAYIAGLVSDSGGNIIRTINNTSPDGSFYLRLVLAGLKDETKARLSELFKQSKFPLDKIEIV